MVLSAARQIPEFFRCLFNPCGTVFGNFARLDELSANFEAPDD
jgi:hypothetical protein